MSIKIKTQNVAFIDPFQTAYILFKVAHAIQSKIIVHTHCYLNGEKQTGIWVSGDVMTSWTHITVSSARPAITVHFTLYLKEGSTVFPIGSCVNMSSYMTTARDRDSYRRGGERESGLMQRTFRRLFLRVHYFAKTVGLWEEILRLLWL